MLRINNIKLSPEQATNKREERRLLKIKVSKILRVSPEDLKRFSISKKSIDARDKNNIFCVYSIDTDVENKAGYIKDNDVSKIILPDYIAPEPLSGLTKRPVVIGSGPAGLFAALVLAEAGLAPIIIERGKDVDSRKADVTRFFEDGILNEESNIQFGEGGAGTFSDGKLTTGTKDIRIHKVIKEFIEASAPEEIAYLSKPHIGTDILTRVMKKIREKIENLGGEYHFNSKLTGLVYEKNCLVGLKIQPAPIPATAYDSVSNEYFLETDHAILAIGHSARDTFEMLNLSGVNMSPKSFAVGIRIEHLQKDINFAQYGRFGEFLPPADYKLTSRSGDGRAVYTFCMCPGGLVVPASSEANRLVVNGMSNYRRDSLNANSAVIVSVSPKDFGTGVLDGINFQRKLEESAFRAGGNYRAPVQLLGDFLENRASKSLGGVSPSCLTGYTLCDLRECLDGFIVDALREGITDMAKRIPAFGASDAVLTAVESRTSSPVTIFRDENLNSNIHGLMPCGEGAGHAGGIISAAIDGIRCAESILTQEMN